MKSDSDAAELDRMKINEYLDAFPSPPKHRIRSRQRSSSGSRSHQQLDPTARMFRRFLCERTTPTWTQFQPLHEFCTTSSAEDLQKTQESVLLTLAMESPYTENYAHQKLLQSAKTVLKGVGGFLLPPHPQQVYLRSAAETICSYSHLL